MKNNSINPTLDRVSANLALERDYIFVAALGGIREFRICWKIRLALQALSARCATAFARRSA